MKSSKKTLLMIVIVILHNLSCSYAFGQTNNSISKITQQIIDSTYISLMKKNDVKGVSISIIDNGKIVYSRGFGYADVETLKPATDSTIYRVGSITKSFTALSILQLKQSSIIDINKPLSNYISEFSIKSAKTGENQQVLIKDVLSHTSGLPPDIMNAFFASSPPDQNWTINQLKNQYAIAPAGYLMAYSNVGYALLGELIARTSKMSYEDYLTENIFKPLKMRSSGIYLTEDNSLKLSTGYLKNKPCNEPYLRDVAAGQIYSSVLDISNYILMNLNKGSFNGTEILNESFIDQMHQNKLKHVKVNNGTKYGYGLFIKDLLGVKSESSDSTFYSYIGHGGNTYVYHTNFGFIPELGVGAVIMTNTDNGRKITNIPDLLNLYLENEKGIELSPSFLDSMNMKVRNLAQGDILKGDYASMLGLINISDVNKIKFKQGPAKIILKRTKEKPIYSGKAYLWGFIPFRIKDQEFYFEEVDNNIFLKINFPSKQKEEIIGIKVQSQNINPSWMNAIGEYKMKGEMFDVPECFPFDFSDATAEIKMENGFLTFSLETSSPELNTSFALQIINDTDAIGYTYSRNTGNTVQLLSGNHLYYNGFKLHKVAK